MKPFLLALAFVLISACSPLQPVVVPPTMRPVAIRTCVANAHVQVADAGVPFSVDADGDVTIPIPGDAFNLHVTANGYPQYDAVVTFEQPGPKQVLIGSCVPLTDPELQVQLPVWHSLRPDTGERGAVHVDGLRFVREDGSTFPWRGIDGFLLYQHWLAEREGIDDIVTDWLTCGGLCNARGPNVVRVFGMVTWGPLYPQDHADYYDQLRPFVDHLWSTFHLRVEFVIFADTTPDNGRPDARAKAGIIPSRDAQNIHAHRVLDALASAENVFLEVSNEPFKNIEGGGFRAFEIGQTLQNRGPPIASGDYDEPWHTALDYITVHLDRSDEWPRKAKDLLDIRNGDVGRDVGGWRGDRPVVGDEPIGFAEVARPGARSASAEDAASFAAACQLFAAGCTYHSDSGTEYARFGPVQARAAAAFSSALHFIPPDAQLAPYQRGAEFGGLGVGNMPMEHTDAMALRTFCKAVNGSEYCVAMRPAAGWTATARDGWAVAEQPLRGLVRLAR